MQELLKSISEFSDLLVSFFPYVEKLQAELEAVKKENAALKEEESAEGAEEAKAKTTVDDLLLSLKDAHTKILTLVPTQTPVE
jgi:hypothetical protein